MLSVVAAMAGVSGAETFAVTTTVDGVTGSLREALEDADANADEQDTIEFALSDGSVITLLSALPSVNGDVTFDTLGGQITVDGSIASPYYGLPSLWLLTFEGLSLEGGSIDSAGISAFVFQGDTDVTIGSDLTGMAFAFEKFGAGTATIAGATAVALPDAVATVYEGTLEVASGGSASFDSLSVESGATLAGEGSVSTDLFLAIRSGATLSGGLALTAGTDFTAEAGATLPADLSVTAGNDISLASSSPFSGAVSLSAGNEILLGSGSTLSGSGTLSASAITLAGRVMPSTTTGTYDLTGATTFASGSIYEADLQPDGDGDRISVTGGVTIDPGAQLVTLLDPGADYSAPVDVTILEADSITGQFDFTTNSGFLFVSQSVDYADPTAVVVHLQPTAVDLDLTPNQQHVFDVVNGATPDPGSDLAAVQTVIDSSFQGSADAYRELLDAIGGESLTAYATGRQLLGERTARALHRRARDPAWGPARAVYAVDALAPVPLLAGPVGTPLGWRAAAPATAPVGGPAPVAAPGPRTRVGAWLDAFGQYGELDGDASGSADLESVLYGGTLGLDVWLADRVLLGLAGGYARADLDPDGRDVDATSDTIQGALYAGYADPRGYLSAYGRYAYSFLDSTRHIEATQLQRDARASWDAQDYGFGAEGGVTVFEIGGFGLQPVAGIDWLRLTEKSYRESGASSLALDVDPEDLESTTARFGGRLFGEIDLDGTGLLVPELRGFWQRAYGDRERVLRARLLGAATGGALAVRGAELPRDVVILGVGWSASVGELLQVLLDYDALLDTDRVEHQGSLAVRYRF